MCDCREAVNERLAISNAKIATGITINVLEGGPTATMDESPPQIVLERLDPRKRGGKLPHLIATCCPFCGERYEPESQAVTETAPGKGD